VRRPMTARTICYNSAGLLPRYIDRAFKLHRGSIMAKSKDKDTKKMVKKEALKTPKEKKEAKKLKKQEKLRG
jgi:hypothetical protein